MNFIDIILIILIVLALSLALKKTISRGKNGCACCNGDCQCCHKREL